jgi:hypothetical protein
VDALFFQLVEDRFRVAVESALEIVDGLTGTFQLVRFHAIHMLEVSVAGAVLVFLDVGREIGDVTEMMIELVDVRRVVVMTSGIIDGQSHAVVA